MAAIAKLCQKIIRPLSYEVIEICFYMKIKVIYGLGIETSTYLGNISSNLKVFRRQTWLIVFGQKVQIPAILGRDY
jgi:hypothetical protein